MTLYQTRYTTIPGTDYKTVYKRAMDIFKTIKSNTKRKPFLKSAFFKGDKVFFDHFWNHIRQKRYPDRTRRLKYFAAATDLIEHCRNKPETMINPNRKSEILHRFAGLTLDKQLFYIQIKENKKGQKQLMSIFPGK